MGKFLFNVIAYGFMLFTAVSIGLYHADIDIDADTIENQMSKATGRNVTVNDEVDFSLFPRLGFNVRNLKVENPEGFSDPYFVEADAAVAAVKILPLLSGTVEISEFVLTRAVIRLERNASGEASWALESNDDEAKGTDGSGPNVTRRVRDLRLGDVRLVDGDVSYDDRVKDQRFELTDVNLAIVIPSLYQPSNATGSFVYNDEKVSVEVSVDTLAKLRSGDAAKAALTAGFLDAKLRVDVTAQNREALSYRGALSVDVPSVRNVLTWWNNPISIENGFERLEVSGAMVGDMRSMKFENAAIKFDAIEGAGPLTADWGNERTLLSGDLVLDMLDLRPYTPAPPETEGFPPWSRERINFEALKVVDMDFDVVTRKLLVRNLDVDDSAFDFTLRRGVLNATLNRIALYDGMGTGELTLDVSRSTPRISGRFNLANIDARRFLNDATRLDRLEGVGDLNFEIAARGASQNDMISTLNGSGAYNVEDGSIIGFDFLKFAYQIGVFVTGQYQGSEVGVDRTAFTGFGADFRIRNGVVTTDNIALLSPLLRITGEGEVNLPPQTIDIRLNPRLVASLKGQGGDRDKQGIGIPVKLTGTFNESKLRLDPGQAARQRAEDEARRRIDDMLGGDKEDVDSSSAKDAIEGIFGRKKEDN
ncbi:MAG: AsmA family protein [Marinicaulis sp.]|nr:AsmA family protein [Marinicaulis sp.]